MLVVHIFKKHNHTNYSNTLLTQLIKNAIITPQHNQIMVNFRTESFPTKLKQNNVKPPRMVSILNNKKDMLLTNKKVIVSTGYLRCYLAL